MGVLDHCSGRPERFSNPNMKFGLFRVERSEIAYSLLLRSFPEYDIIIKKKKG